ncbi:MAG TPA: hypothetical protein VH165_28280 [Kofleriaceae bacterium]|jgi:hypothetical protein|nr:hypothetical protein [Kofleriaceae bacterium]
MSISIRSLLVIGAISLAGAGTASAGGSSHGGGDSSGNFTCTNGVGVGCIGQVGLIPVNINMPNLSVLDGADLALLSGDLDNWAVLNGNILDCLTILNGIQVNVLSVVLQDFNIILGSGNVDVCTPSLLGLALCI